jgi:uncharacterized protein YqjF (DUF2071 family)
MSGVRMVLTPPIPWLSSFHEVNVRTYVHRHGRDPGVWFFSLDTSSALAVEGARAFYKLPYFHAQIDFSESCEFTSRRDDPSGAKPADIHVRYQGIEGPVAPAQPGTLDHFLVERYLLYAMDEHHQLYRARVHHQPYPLQRAEVSELQETLLWAAGIRRGDAPHIRPQYAREVSVTVDPLRSAGVPTPAGLYCSVHCLRSIPSDGAPSRSTTALSARRTSARGGRTGCCSTWPNGRRSMPASSKTRCARSPRPRRGHWTSRASACGCTRRSETLSAASISSTAA